MIRNGHQTHGAIKKYYANKRIHIFGHVIVPS